MLMLFGVIAAISNSTLAILMSVLGAPLEGPWTIPWAITYVPAYISVVIVPATTIAIRVSGRSPS
jgi:hypothetical protein